MERCQAWLFLLRRGYFRGQSTKHSPWAGQTLSELCCRPGLFLPSLWLSRKLRPAPRPSAPYPLLPPPPLSFTGFPAVSPLQFQFHHLRVGFSGTPAGSVSPFTQLQGRLLRCGILQGPAGEGAPQCFCGPSCPSSGRVPRLSSWLCRHQLLWVSGPQSSSSVKQAR